MNSSGVSRIVTNRGSSVTLEDLEQAVLKQLPAGFPIMDPKLECDTAKRSVWREKGNSIHYQAVRGNAASTKSARGSCSVL